MMMKKLAVLLLSLLLLIPATAPAEGSVLLLEIPDDAQMVENIAFDDGDFIQTYQRGGMTLQLLRYASFDMTLNDLIESEWTGCSDVQALDIAQAGGFPAEGVKLRYEQEGTGAVDVTLVLVRSAQSTLVFSAVVPLGDSENAALVEAMVRSMDVRGEAEVG